MRNTTNRLFDVFTLTAAPADRTARAGAAR